MILYRTITRSHKVLSRFISTENVVKSPVADIEIPTLLIHEYVWENLQKWDNKIAIECLETGRKFTYNDIYKRSTSMGGFLQKLGIKNEDKVAVILPNMPEFITATLGILQAGATVTPVNPLYTEDEIRRQMEICDVKAVCILSSLHETVSRAVSNLGREKIPIITVKRTPSESCPSGSIDIEDIFSKSYDLKTPTVSQDSVALLPFSSGTTGLPKGVELTHRNLVANFEQSLVHPFKLTTDTTGNNQDVIPAILPLFHIYGISHVFLTMLSRGVKLLTVPKYTPKALFKIMHEYSPSVIYSVPPIVIDVINSTVKMEKIGSLRYMTSGAAPLRASDVEKFQTKTESRVTLLQMYGMTESSPLTHSQTPFIDNGLKIGGCGFIVPNMECKIIADGDPEMKGVGPGVSGELLMKGPNIMKGYYKNEEATKATLVDGWLKTGDVAHYDVDGQFYITDRYKELIKVKGFPVPPAELEALLRQHPDIADAAVVGVPHHVSGEVPRAFIVAKPNTTINVNAIQEFVNSKVVKYKQLTGGLIILDSIPKTTSGKILRRHLKTL